MIAVTSRNPLVCFIYLLLRDHLPAGIVEERLREAVETEGHEIVYTNGFLANYAEYCADELRPPRKKSMGGISSNDIHKALGKAFHTEKHGLFRNLSYETLTQLSENVYKHLNESL